MSHPCVWLHDAAISPEDLALRSNPHAAVIFVFDEPALREEPVAFHRLDFIFAGVCETFRTIAHPIKEVRRGDPVVEIADFCAEHGCDQIHVTDNPDPRTRQIVQMLRKRHRVVVYPYETLTEYAEEPRRFSRFWEKTAKQVLGYQPRSNHRKFHRG
jgi:hypothetical protein